MDFSDFLPTIAEIAGGSPPAGVTIDGRSFARELRGGPGEAREWIFVELGKHWYVRDGQWKLNEQGELFDMTAAPFHEKAVPHDFNDGAAARKHLQTVLDELDPDGGKRDTGDGSGRHAKKNKNAQTSERSRALKN